MDRFCDGLGKLPHGARAPSVPAPPCAATHTAAREGSVAARARGTTGTVSTKVTAGLRPRLQRLLLLRRPRLQQCGCRCC
jgi:hypothetical protein